MRVLRGATFHRDLHAQVNILVGRQDAEGVDRLSADLAALQDLLAAFPDAGRELAAIDRSTLRKLKLRRCPFVVWYLREQDRVTLTRLFHARQDRRALRGSVLRYEDPEAP